MNEINARIEENESMLKMAQLHMDARSCFVLEDRITELKKMRNIEKEQKKDDDEIEQLKKQVSDIEKNDKEGFENTKKND